MRSSWLLRACWVCAYRLYLGSDAQYVCTDAQYGPPRTGFSDYTHDMEAEYFGYWPQMRSFGECRAECCFEGDRCREFAVALEVAQGRGSNVRGACWLKKSSCVLDGDLRTCTEDQNYATFLKVTLSPTRYPTRFPTPTREPTGDPTRYPTKRSQYIESFSNVPSRPPTLLPTLLPQITACVKNRKKVPLPM